MYRQVHGVNTVAAVNRLQRLRVNAFLSKRLSEEQDRVALTDGVHKRDAVRRMNRQI